MTISELYQKTLDDYGCCVQSSPSLTLLSYCRTQCVNIYALRAWMSRRGLSVYDFKSQGNAVPSPDAPTFAPLHPCAEAEVPSAPDILYGIHITFPDGVSISIKQGSCEGINNFMERYNHKTEEVKSCLR